MERIREEEEKGSEEGERENWWDEDEKRRTGSNDLACVSQSVNARILRSEMLSPVQDEGLQRDWFV